MRSQGGGGRTVPGRTSQTSDGAGGRWEGVDRLPVFGEPPTKSDFLRLFDDLPAEMLRCTRVAPKSSPPDTVNILHVSPDIDLANAEITQMIYFLETIGFIVKREQGPGVWVSADILVLGMDEKQLPNLDGVFDILVRGAGLVQGWDILLYGIGFEMASGLGEPERPLCVGQNFGLDGICMLHAHVRLRGNTHFWIGFFAYMAIEFETYIDRVIGRSEDKLYKKIGRLKREFEDAGLYGPDAEMFVAAAHLIRNVRNTHAHSQRGMLPNERRERDAELRDGVEKFAEMVMRHERPDLLIGFGDYVGSTHGQLRYLTRVALAARRWIYDCHKTAPSRP